MRFGRLAFILLAIYFVFIGGSAYYNLIFLVRLIHHILVTVLLTIWLVGRIRRGLGFPRTPMNPPIFAAIGVWVISAIASIDPRMAFENLWFLLIHVILFFALVDQFQRRRGRLVMETVFMVGAMVIVVSGIELASWYFGLGVIPNTQLGWFDVIGSGTWLPLEPPRLALAMNISTLLAGFVAPLVTLIAAWALTARRDYRIALWMLAGGLLIVLLLTFSRGGLLSILTAAGVLGVLRLIQMPRIGGRFPVRIAAGMVVFGGIVIITSYTILSITQNRSETGGDQGRLDMWQSAIHMTTDNLVTGVGPGLFGRAFRSYRDPGIVQDKLASAHNAYLNTAAETGILGIVVSLWLAVTFGRTWYQRWRHESSRGRKIRLEAALAALLGLAIHSLVDVFTITPIVLLMLVLVAYCVSETDAIQTSRQPRWLKIIPTISTLVVIIGYGVWLFQLDRAQSRYMNSFGHSETAITSTQEAIALDPALNLYHLQIAFLTGQAVSQQPDSDLETAVQAYQEALQREPTWDTGWINLAALELRLGNQDLALTYLDRGRQINERNLATLHWARLAESMDAASDDTIIEAYLTAMRSSRFLPLSAFWWETPLRQAALEQYLGKVSLDKQYRVLAAHDPDRAYQLVDSSPNTADAWWISGEYALTVQNDAQRAITYFSQAIQLAPSNGDYYASRARAVWETDPVAAEHDLDIATLLGTIDEYPDTVRAEMAATAEEANRLRATALPPKPGVQEFAGVLYGRPAQFDVFPEMAGIGPGRATMQPWYDIADYRLGVGDFDGAIRVYAAIVDYAPDEDEAREQLIQLND